MMLLSRRKETYVSRPAAASITSPYALGIITRLNENGAKIGNSAWSSSIVSYAMWAINAASVRTKNFQKIGPEGTSRAVVKAFFEPFLLGWPRSRRAARKPMAIGDIIANGIE